MTNTKLQITKKSIKPRFGNLKFGIGNFEKGFTLIEAIVATAVFAFVLSSIIGVYISVIKLDRKTRSQRAVTQNARFILDFLAKEVSNGRIYYAGYPGGVANSTLSVQNQSNETEYFFISGTNIVMQKGSSTTNLNSTGVRVTKLQFLVSPTQDPYTSARLANIQPHATVVLELTSNYGSNPGDVVKLDLQTTLSSRAYPSRE
jgi:prepilin-type N-terminal cleavage/methylation domain-containing protein